MHPPTSFPLSLPLLLLPLLATPTPIPTGITDNDLTPADAKAVTKTACHDIEAIRQQIAAHAKDGNGGSLSEAEQTSLQMDLMFEQSLGCAEVFGGGNGEGEGDGEGGGDDDEEGGEA